MAVKTREALMPAGGEHSHAARAIRGALWVTGGLTASDTESLL